LPTLHRESLTELLSAASNLFLDPHPHDLFLFGTSFPASHALLPRILSDFIDPSLPQPREIDPHTLTSLLSALKPFAPLPFDWIEFFTPIALGENSAEVQSLFDFKEPGVHWIDPVLFPIGGRRTVSSADGSIDSDVTNSFKNVPPVSIDFL
jgi:hypothetical protein